MRKSRILVAAAAIAVTLTGGLAVASRHDSASAATVWNEDFNGPAGAGVDTSKWNLETGGGGWGNNELETYTNSTDNVSQDGQGHLVITARNNGGTWTSGRINTRDKFSQAYGHFEARIQVPKGNGLWPAFWMLGGNNWPTDGEIDIMEVVGKSPKTLYGTIHGPGYSGGSSIGGTKVLPTDLGDAFHTYAVDWAPTQIVWTLDGAQYFFANPDSIRGKTWVFDHPFHVLLNLAVGGSFPGNPDATTPDTNRMLIDYIHVSTSDTTPPAKNASALKGAGSGRCIDIPGANSANGTRLTIYDCNGTGGQQWALGSDGTVRALGKCLDAAAAGTTDGTAIQLYDCNGTGAQKFTLSPAGDLVNIVANKCVDVTYNASANSSPLQLWTCTGGANQKWSKA